MKTCCVRLDVTLIHQDVRLRCSRDEKMLRPVMVADAKEAIPLRPVHLLPPIVSNWQNKIISMNNLLLQQRLK